MSRRFLTLTPFFIFFAFFVLVPQAHAALTLTAGNGATTTPNVATAITGFQIVGPGASSTPLKIHVCLFIVVYNQKKRGCLPKSAASRNPLNKRG